jgi:hypothetical protein
MVYHSQWNGYEKEEVCGCGVFDVVEGYSERAGVLGDAWHGHGDTTQRCAHVIIASHRMVVRTQLHTRGEDGDCAVFACACCTALVAFLHAAHHEASA